MQLRGSWEVLTLMGGTPPRVGFAAGGEGMALSRGCSVTGGALEKVELEGPSQGSGPFISQAQRGDARAGPLGELGPHLDQKPGSAGLMKPLVSPKACATRLLPLGPQELLAGRSPPPVHPGAASFPGSPKLHLESSPG